MDYREALANSDKDAVSEISVPRGIPDALGQFTGLRTLRLSGNTDIKDFSFLSSLSTLEELHLDKMELSSIPDVVTEMPALTTLFLGDNSITDFSVLAKIKKLIDLGIESMDLKKIPEVLGDLKNLKVLGMSNNEIKSLKTLKDLKSLEALYAGNNRLKKLPKWLAKMPLRQLHVPNNFPLTGYEVLETLTELEELTLTNSVETPSIPACVFGLEKLKALSLNLRWEPGNPQIEGLEEIGALTELEELKIKGTAIKRLPDGIGELRKLRKLTLEENKALENTDALRDLPKLEELDLTKCPLTELGDHFSTLKTLKVLKLGYNKELERVDGLRELPELETLDLYGKMAVLPESLSTLGSLKKLKLTAKANDLSFLRSFTKLEELFLNGCDFDSLPPELTNLKSLTVFRDNEGDDSYLAAYTKLEVLDVSQPSFTLPLLPNLKRLEVSRIKSSVDLTHLPSLEKLEELSYDRSDACKELPAEISQAKQIKRATFEFLEQLSDLSAIGGMSSLEELKLSYLEVLTTLPKEMAGLAKLRKLDMGNLEAVEDASALGLLPALEWLRMTYFGLEALPESMANLATLKYVRLRSHKKLKDISALESAAGLEELSVEYCDSLRRKSISKVEEAISARTGGGAELKMSYRQFIDSGFYKSLIGKEDSQHTYGFPLWFDTPSELLEAVEHFSWLDDIRYDEDLPENAILTDEDADLKLVAVLDLGWEGCDTEHIDSYCEEIFLVDTTSPRNPVFLWGHDGSPAKIHDDFDAFLASLRPFVIEGQEEEAAAQGEESSDSVKRYFEFVDEKSSKFWQVVVTGSLHEVTYGKIGKDGSSKTKEFDSPEAAQKDADKLIASKTKKGYVEKK